MLRYSNNASKKSDLASAAFFMSVFSTLTALSAFPLLFGYPGLDFVCVNSQLCANSSNALHTNCGPLSVIRLFRIPCLENCFLVLESLHLMLSFLDGPPLDACCLIQFYMPKPFFASATVKTFALLNRGRTSSSVGIL